MELTLRNVYERPASFLRNTRFFSPQPERGFEDLVDEFFGCPAVVPVGVGEMGGLFNPRLDIKETKESIQVVAELPGMDRNDIDVSMHEHVLTISGEKKGENEDKGTNYHRVERTFGSFSRSISLPDTVEAGKIEAAYRDGVLVVTLPKTERAIEGSRKIPITA
ncbi:MAG: Hsp20/alpha crystallin family protein [Syntrophorhabdales bacterium]|jgi:HSP20 family protein